MTETPARVASQHAGARRAGAVDRAPDTCADASRGASAASSRKVLEKDAQKTIVAWLRVHLVPPAYVASVENARGAKGKTQQERIRFGAAVKASGRVAGQPDLQVHAPGGRMVFIECKRPKGGTLSDDQRRVHADLRALGFDVIPEARSVEDVRDGLLALGIPLRRSRLDGEATW